MSSTPAARPGLWGHRSRSGFPEQNKNDCFKLQFKMLTLESVRRQGEGFKMLILRAFNNFQCIIIHHVKTVTLSLSHIVVEQFWQSFFTALLQFIQVCGHWLMYRIMIRLRSGLRLGPPLCIFILFQSFCHRFAAGLGIYFLFSG